MYGKLLLLTVGALAIAAGLLVARHQRAQITYEIMQTQQQARELQREVWLAQTDAARRVAPSDLRQRIAVAELRLEPAAPKTVLGVGPTVVDRTDPNQPSHP